MIYLVSAIEVSRLVSLQSLEKLFNADNLWFNHQSQWYKLPKEFYIDAPRSKDIYVYSGKKKNQ